MFEKFQVLYTFGSYYVDEKFPVGRYVAKHFDSESRGKWCKVHYEVNVKDGYYTCECGMLSCHVLKVHVHLRITWIPSLDVMKRWTLDAHDVLPLHLKQYHKDQGMVKSFIYRRSQ